MAKYNIAKLKKLQREAKSLHAEYMALSDEYLHFKENVAELRRNIQEHDGSAEINQNKLEYLVRTGKLKKDVLKPGSIRFLDFPLESLLNAYEFHPINNTLAKVTLERYLAAVEELNELYAYREEVLKKHQLILGLRQRCEDFLKENGVNIGGTGTHGLIISGGI
ncbi:hypothetical protein Q9L42_017260 [Methylomarinum sp. Ch1-1]|uniref:Uncharacterized protein n=1 Tax=Methylomarinum roseum TaxID=3067653 RepID=A0AAU7NT13_9GAMM